MAKINVFGLVPPNVNTCSYIFSFSPDGKLYFGFGRKVPPDYRLKPRYRNKYPHLEPAKIPHIHKCGAAGTETKYHGKWVSLGGSVNLTK